jgi:hypothetical protein
MTHMATAEASDHDRVYALNLDGQRAELLAVLQKSAPVAVTVPELWHAGLMNIHFHIDALKLLGYKFTRLQVTRKSGKVWAWRYDGGPE